MTFHNGTRLSGEQQQSHWGRFPTPHLKWGLVIIRFFMRRSWIILWGTHWISMDWQRVWIEILLRSEINRRQPYRRKNMDDYPERAFGPLTVLLCNCK